MFKICFHFHKVRVHHLHTINTYYHQTGLVLSQTFRYASRSWCSAHPSYTQEFQVLFQRFGFAPNVSGAKFDCLIRVVLWVARSERRWSATFGCDNAKLLDSHGSLSMSYRQSSLALQGGRPYVKLVGQRTVAVERMKGIWWALVGWMYPDDDAAVMARPAKLWITEVKLYGGFGSSFVISPK